MTGKPARTLDYLGHMVDAIGRIDTYLAGMDVAAFLRDLRTQDAVIRNLEVIGEAARNIQQCDPIFAAGHPDIPWALAYRMRNALSHGYADIDLETVWNTTRNDLPPMERQLRALLAQATTEGDPPGRTA